MKTKRSMSKMNVVHKQFSGMLPPPADCCQVCAVKHEPELPHNADSLFYQVSHQMQHGRGVNWHDAMQHCTPEMQVIWRNELLAWGVDPKRLEPYQTA